MNHAYYLLTPLVALGVAAIAAGQLPALFESQSETAQEPIQPECPEGSIEADSDWILRA